MRVRPQPQNHPQKDIWLYRLIIAALDGSGILAVVSAIVSASFGECLSNVVIALPASGMSGKPGFPVPIHSKR